MRWNELQPKFSSCDAIIRWLRRHFLKRLLLLQVSAVLICSGQILTLTHRPRWDAKYPFGKTPLTYCRCPKLKITVVWEKNHHVIRGQNSDILRWLLPRAWFLLSYARNSAIWVHQWKFSWKYSWLRGLIIVITLPHLFQMWHLLTFCPYDDC